MCARQCSRKKLPRIIIKAFKIFVLFCWFIFCCSFKIIGKVPFSLDVAFEDFRQYPSFIYCPILWEIIYICLQSLISFEKKYVVFDVLVLQCMYEHFIHENMENRNRLPLPFCPHCFIHFMPHIQNKPFCLYYSIRIEGKHGE